MNYKKLVEVYEKLEKTSKRLKKTHIISQFLNEADIDSLPMVTLLLQGKLYANWDDNKLGVASRIILKAINLSTGISKIEEEWKKTGDLGIAAQNMIGKKKQSTLFHHDLTIKKVFSNLRKLATLTGYGTVDKKVQLISELLTSADSTEAKYIVRSVLEELRVGVGEGSLRDAIVWAFFKDKIGLSYIENENQVDVKDRITYDEYVSAVQRAYDLSNDFGLVAQTSKKHGLEGLKKIDMELFKPIKVMLALKVPDPETGFDRCGKPAACEYKLDGFRIQAHNNSGQIKIYTRRLEDVTAQFPEIVAYLKKNIAGNNYIFDSEAVGFDPKTKKYLPFQKISQRIKRKYNINEMSSKFPVELNIFDILYYDGKNLLDEPLEKRRGLLEKIVNPVPKKIVLVKNLITSSINEVEDFYHSSLDAGNEGIMMKNLKAPYKPGARVNFMVKLKPVMETLDLVIVAAEWGQGKRSNWLSSFTLACINDDGNYLEIGKVGTGIKETTELGVSFAQLTEELKPLIISEKGKEVRLRPIVVVEIDYEEIQKSPTYSSGYALRFPRLKALRLDRNASEISTIGMVEDFYYGQNK
ncbi:MAG: ATP-dependent DNA ligase [Nanoarchaeota archaeon]